MKKIKIGIPRTNYYYKYGVFWKHFFLNLGCKILLSPETNNKIIENGENNLINSNCLQNKIYYGHIKELSNTCDYILVYKECNYQTNCINYKLFIESIKNHLISSQILSINSKANPLFEALRKSLKLTKNPIKIVYSILIAYKKQRNYNLNIQNNQKNMFSNQEKKVLIISNNLIYDKYLSITILNYLNNNGITPLFTNNLSKKEVKLNMPYIKDNFFNTEINNVIGAIEYYQYNIKHIIFMSNNNCIVENLMYNYIKKEFKKIPITKINGYKEQQLETKLELLIDTINNSN